MKAAKNFSFGRGEHRKDGAPISYKFKTGEDIPDDIAEELDDEFILERVAEDSPNDLTREQLMMLAGVGDYAGEESAIEYDEEDLIEALSNLRSKADVVEWFETVHPSSGLLNPDDQTRVEMVELIVEELTGE